MVRDLTTFQLLVALFEELLKLLVVNFSPADGTRLPLPTNHFKVRKGARGLAEVDKRDVSRPAFDNDFIALDNVAEIIRPVHLRVFILSDCHYMVIVIRIVV